MRINKNRLIFICTIIFSVACTWIFVRQIELATLKSAFQNVEYIYIIPTVILIFILFVLQTVRWKIIVSPLKHVSFCNLFSATIIGYMANYFLPARMGELIRPLIISKKEDVKVTSMLATVALERTVDLLGLIIFTIATLLFLPTPTNNIPDDISVSETIDSVSQTTKVVADDNNGFLVTLRKWIGVFAGIGIATILFLVSLVLYPARSAKVLQKLFTPFPEKVRIKIEGFLDSFISGLQILGNRKQTAWIFFYTMLIYVILALVFYVFSFAFGMNLPFVAACFVSICIILAMALPQAPGYFGVFHIATQKSLEIYNIDTAHSQSYAISVRFLCFITNAVMGLFFLWKDGIAFKELLKQKK